MTQVSRWRSKSLDSLNAALKKFSIRRTNDEVLQVVVQSITGLCNRSVIKHGLLRLPGLRPRAKQNSLRLASIAYVDPIAHTFHA